VDAGALCLSSSERDPLALRNPHKSYGREDGHKAPTLPHIRPLSLQDEGGRFLSSPDSVVKHHRDFYDILSDFTTILYSGLDVLTNEPEPCTVKHIRLIWNSRKQAYYMAFWRIDA
jgi:hypothetical protein